MSPGSDNHARAAGPRMPQHVGRQLLEAQRKGHSRFRDGGSTRLEYTAPLGMRRPARQLEEASPAGRCSSGYETVRRRLVAAQGEFLVLLGSETILIAPSAAMAAPTSTARHAQ